MEKPSKYGPEEIRSEYSAVVSYHSSIVNSRFTIAGLYVAAVGFLAGAILKENASIIARIAGSGLGCWLTLCLWILELRSRALFTNLAHRGMDIEHNYWGFNNDEDWYRGFFSRQYKEPPGYNPDIDELSRRVNPDRPTLGWATLPINNILARYISHSLGLDLLYIGCGLFFIITVFSSLLNANLCPCASVLFRIITG